MLIDKRAGAKVAILVDNAPAHIEKVLLDKIEYFESMINSKSFKAERL